MGNRAAMGQLGMDTGNWRVYCYEWRGIVIMELLDGSLGGVASC